MSHKWVFDEGNARVVTEDDSENVFYTHELECPEYVIEKIVALHNEDVNDFYKLGPEGSIDMYLLDEGECSQEDREIIVEQIYAYYQNQLK